MVRRTFADVLRLLLERHYLEGHLTTPHLHYSTANFECGEAFSTLQFYTAARCTPRLRTAIAPGMPAALLIIRALTEKMLALGEAGLKRYIKTIGLFNTKAKNVMALSRLLLERHGGAVPQDRDALEALPGGGRKTANLVLNIWFGEPTIAVDTHVVRVGNRTGLAPGNTPLAVEQMLEKIVPADRRRHAHHWLILHGRYICKASKPNSPV